MIETNQPIKENKYYNEYEGNHKDTKLENKGNTLIRCTLNYNEMCNLCIEKYVCNEEFKVKINLSKDGAQITYNDTIIAQNSEVSFVNEIEYESDINIVDNAIEIPVKRILVIKPEEKEIQKIYDLAKEIKYEEKVKFLIEENNVPIPIIKLLLNKVKSNFKSVAVPKPDNLYYDKDKNRIAVCLLTVLNEGHVRLFGDKSTGKNTFVDTISWLLNREYIKFPGSPYTDKSDLVEETCLVNIKDENNNSVVITQMRENALVTAMKKGCILLMDEINFNSPSVLGILHGPTDKSRSLLLSSGKMLKAHPDFCVIATMNEGYCGTQKLNNALLDRMVGIEFLEIPIINFVKEARPEINNHTVAFLDKVYKKLKSLAKSGQLIEPIPYSVRGFLDLADQIEMGIAQEYAFETAIVNRISDKTDREIIKNSLGIC